MKFRKVNVIASYDWDALVMSVYDRPYCFQQQYGCQDRGLHKFTVPGKSHDNEMNADIPDVCNCNEMGVRFETWLKRDTKKPVMGVKDEGPLFENELRFGIWWERNFYPDIQTVANDLYAKGIIEAGEYGIYID